MTAWVKDKLYERWRLQIFLITWLTYASYYLTRKAFAVAKLGILDDPMFDMTKEVMANVDAVYLLSYAIGQFIWGIMADKVGPRYTVIGGLIMTVVATFIMGFYPAVTVFLVVSIFQGLAQSTGWSSLCKNVGRFFSLHERGRVMGFWCTSYTIGGLVATPLAGWFAYSLFDDWRYAFIGPAAVVVMVLVLFIIFQRNKPQDIGLPPIEQYHNEVLPVDYQESSTTDTPPSVWQQITEVCSNRTILLLGLIYFLLKPARYAILFWGPYIIYEMLEGTDKITAATIPVTFEVAEILGPIIVGYASDKLFNARRIPVCIISLLILSITLAAFIPMIHGFGMWGAIGALFIIGMTAYGPDSMVSSTAAMDFGTKNGAGTATGFVNGCGSVGAIFGGLLPGYLDMSIVFYGFAAANLLACVLLIPFWNLMPNTADTPVVEDKVISKT